MESIKHKMDAMVKEKEAATEKAIKLEAEAAEYQKTLTKFEKEVSDVQRKIAKVEDELDITISSTKDTAEKLEHADKEAVDAELQAGALKRRLALLEEETARVKERLQENVEKCKTIETAGAENEDARKAGEARSFAAEESLEQMESQLDEANEVAKMSNQKFEDAGRKLKVVEGDLERILERAEEFETKAREIETQVREQESKVKETEAITVKNADEEEKFENKISHLQEEFKTSDTRAEFAERSVDKLEATIDGLLEALMNEKMNYRNISEKLDKTLNDMMSMT